ncbi:hypothetical protein LTR49_020766 [Elasticomyces elasticus]|nr:hypothetical protein LTR49_020766 [Elasticomyces elasticus]
MVEAASQLVQRLILEQCDGKHPTCARCISKQSDRTFQFVSDPNHKGPPPRKRPIRDAVVRRPEEAPSPSTPYNDTMLFTKSDVVSTFQRPSAIRPPISRYSSHQQELRSSDSLSTSASLGTAIEAALAGPGRPIPRMPPLDTDQHIAPARDRQEGDLCPPSNIHQDRSPFIFTETFYSHDSDANYGSSSATGSNEGSSIPRHGGSGPPLTILTATQAGPMPTQSGQPPRSSATMTSDTVDTSSQRSTAGSWPVYPNQHSGQDPFIQVAEALEEQANSLRQVARHRQSLDLHESQLYMLQLQQTPQPSNPDQVAFSAMPDASAPPYHFNPSTNGGTCDVDFQQISPLQYGGELSIAGLQNDIHQQGTSQANSGYGRSDQGSTSSASYGSGAGRERMRRTFDALLVSDHAAAAARSSQDA